MVRSAVSKVMWVGRATVFLVGLAVILALMFGVATAAFGDDGDFFKVGRSNFASALSTHSRSGAGPALSLKVGSGAPLKVNSTTKVAKLNADMVDDMNASDLLQPRGYAHIAVGGGVDTNYPSKGVVDVLIPEGKTAVYCFDLTFTPTAAVGSPHFNNSAVVAAATPDNGPADDPVTLNCPTTHRDAAVHTFGSNTGAPAAINFQVVYF